MTRQEIAMQGKFRLVDFASLAKLDRDSEITNFASLAKYFRDSETEEFR